MPFSTRSKVPAMIKGPVEVQLVPGCNMSGMTKNVLLLRAPDEDGQDRYEAAFKARGYVPFSVPVLETTFVHVDGLRDKIGRGPEAEGLSGVIVTSKRAVEAWCEAIRSMEEKEMQADWRKVPFYVVGAATAVAVSQIHAALPTRVRFAPAEANVRGGAEAGTGERLAAFILRDLGDDGLGRKMLYLTGDKNRETLPELLAGSGVALETVEVYRTTGSSTFRADLEAAAAVVERAASIGQDLWVVHFAPSAAKVVVPVLKEVFGDVKTAAIGPTTASFLRDELGVHVDVVASRPTPDAVVDGIDG